MMRAYSAYILFKDSIRNLTAFTYNWTLGWVGSGIDYEYSRRPIDAPSLMARLYEVYRLTLTLTLNITLTLMTRLYEVHGYEMFNVGAFNADPHAGNVILDEVRVMFRVRVGVRDRVTIYIRSHDCIHC